MKEVFLILQGFASSVYIFGWFLGIAVTKGWDAFFAFITLGIYSWYVITAALAKYYLQWLFP